MGNQTLKGLHPGGCSKLARPLGGLRRGECPVALGTQTSGEFALYSAIMSSRADKAPKRRLSSADLTVSVGQGTASYVLLMSSLGARHVARTSCSPRQMYNGILAVATDPSLSSCQQ